MRYLVIGGTGTLGRALIKEIYAREPHAVVTVFSRDELKQKQLQLDFPKVKCVLGDIRDRQAVDMAMIGMNTVFHVAALKHIDIIENNPVEAVKTNIIGTINVAESAIHACVPWVAFCSTDKAFEPLNVYGMSKAIAAKQLLRFNETQIFTKFSVFTWGNVAGSRGSVIPTFVDTLKSEQKVYITHPSMTRFWIKIESAAEFMFEQFRNPGTHLIPCMKAAQISRVAHAVADILEIKNYTTVITGIRPGEKMHEALAPNVASNTAKQFTDEELREFLYPIVKAIA